MSLHRRLGAGAFGTVFQATSARTKARVAIKVVSRAKLFHGNDLVLAELELLRVFSAVNSDTASDTLYNFCCTYGRQRGKDLDFVKLALMRNGAHLIKWTPRNPTWPERGRDKVREVVYRGIQYLIDAKEASREYLSRSPIGGLLDV